MGLLEICISTVIRHMPSEGVGGERSRLAKGARDSLTYASV